jgi:hypothetical protein
MSRRSGRGGVSADGWGRASARALAALAASSEPPAGLDLSLLATPWRDLAALYVERGQGAPLAAFLASLDEGALRAAGVGSADWCLARVGGAIDGEPPRSVVEELARARLARDAAEVHYGAEEGRP